MLDVLVPIGSVADMFNRLVRTPDAVPIRRSVVPAAAAARLSTAPARVERRGIERPGELCRVKLVAKRRQVPARPFRCGLPPLATHAEDLDLVAGAAGAAPSSAVLGVVNRRLRVHACDDVLMRLKAADIEV